MWLAAQVLNVILSDIINICLLFKGHPFFLEIHFESFWSNLPCGIFVEFVEPFQRVSYSECFLHCKVALFKNK